MKKNKFIRSTFILIIGGFLTKMLGMIIKIVTTRIIGSEGIGIYSLIMPTFMLLLSIAQLGLPTALNIMIAEEKRNSKNLIAWATIISIFIDIIIMIMLLFCSNFIANNLLHDDRTYYGLLAIGFVLPFISISNMLRSYFFGKQRMLPHVLTNVIEDICKLILIVIGLAHFLSKGIEFAVCYIILCNIICELCSIVIFMFLLPNFKMSKSDLKLDKKNIKDMFKICIPITGSRLIGNIGYFLEPIIITFILLKIGYSKDFVVTEYGIINGFVMQLVLLPSFFTSAISQALIPNVSNAYVNGRFDYIKKKLKQAIFVCLLIGIPATICFELFPDILLKFLFNTNEGINYIRVIAPICLLHYIQAPISSSLQSMNKARIAMTGTLIGMLLRTLCLIIFSLMNIGLWGLIIATSINMIFVTCYDYKNVKRILKK